MPNHSDQSDFVAKSSFKASIAQEGPKGSKISSRSYLRVRSNGSAFNLNKTESKVLEDPSESFDFFYKLIIIGDEQVGKSNLLLRMAKGYFDKKPKTTYGVEFEFKTVPLPNSN
jgi:hypothetical protein